MNESIRIDMDHYHKVRKERELRGLPVSPMSFDMPEHPWFNRKLLCIENNKIYTIDRVWKVYEKGYCIAARIECNGSHGIIYIGNISSVNQAIIDCIDTLSDRYKLLPVDE